MSKQSRRSPGDVYWYVAGRKRPIAYSTVAASRLIVELAQELDTIQEIHDAINYDEEARQVLKKYIEKGYGNAIARNFFK